MFWRLTLREIVYVLGGATAKRRFDHNQMMHGVHAGAKLTAYAPSKAKDFPPLDCLLIRETTGPARPKHWTAVFAKVTAWVKGAQGK